MICRQCGSEVKSGAKFCTNCGKKLEQNTNHLEEKSKLINEDIIQIRQYTETKEKKQKKQKKKLEETQIEEIKNMPLKNEGKEQKERIYGANSPETDDAIKETFSNIEKFFHRFTTEKKVKKEVYTVISYIVGLGIGIKYYFIEGDYGFWLSAFSTLLLMGIIKFLVLLITGTLKA